MKLLQFNLVIIIALIFASCHSQKQIVIVHPFNPHCAYELESHPHKGDDGGCPHQQPDDISHCRCGIEETLDESANSPQEDNQSCGCATRGSETSIKWGFGDVPREVREQALKEMLELHFLCGVKAEDNDGTVLLPAAGESCGCGVAGVPGILSAPGVPREFIEGAIRGMPGMIAPQCGCGVDRAERRKAILEQGLKLLDRDTDPQPEAGENDADRAGESAAQ